MIALKVNAKLLYVVHFLLKKFKYVCVKLMHYETKGNLVRMFVVRFSVDTYRKRYILLNYFFV